MGTTQNYGYNVPVGSDNVNLLPQMAANFPMIDSDLKAVSNAAIGSATELTTGTVHALTRADTSRNVFVFVATSDYEAGETFEVDGVQVTAKTPDGQNLSTGAYVINSGVLCVLNGTLLTVIVNPAKALDADKLDGHDSTYFATAGDLTVLDNQVGAISTKVGTGVLDVGNDCVDGINTLNTHLNNKLGLTLVWSNSSPTANFDAQFITLASNTADFYLVSTKAGDIIVSNGNYGGVNYTGLEIGQPYHFDRMFRSDSYTSMYVGNCYKIKYSDGTRTADNASLIPLAVYALK